MFEEVRDGSSEGREFTCPIRRSHHRCSLTRGPAVARKADIAALPSCRSRAQAAFAFGATAATEFPNTASAAATQRLRQANALPQAQSTTPALTRRSKTAVSTEIP